MRSGRAKGHSGSEAAFFLLAVSRAASRDEPPDDSLKRTAARLADEPFRWERLLGLARRHSSVAAVYRFAADTGLESRVPAEILRAMKLGYALAQATYIKNLIELRELADGLRRGGVTGLVLKGIPLASRLYTEPAVRVSRDIDLLCRMEDLGRVERLLEEEGYSLHEGRLGGDRYRRYHYHLVYSRGSESESVVEVHWNVRHPGKGALIDTGELFRHAFDSDIAGTRIAALDDPRSLWQLAVNLSYGGFLEARDLGDLRRLGRRLSGDDWEGVAAFSRKTATFNELSTALAVAEKTFGPFVPREYRSVTRPRFAVRTMFLPPYTPRAVAWRWLPFGGAQRLSVNLFMRQGLGRKLRYLYHILIPDTASLIETRAARPAPKRGAEAIRLYIAGAWIALKVITVSALFGAMTKAGFGADGWANPERHVDLTASPRRAGSEIAPRRADPAAR
jgi:hypothetical protein